MDQREQEFVEVILADSMNGPRRERMAREHAPHLLPSTAPERYARIGCFRTQIGVACRCVFGEDCA